MKPGSRGSRKGTLADQDSAAVNYDRHGNGGLAHSGFGTKSSSRPGDPIML
jgi:hypothetical protein